MTGEVDSVADPVSAFRAVFDTCYADVPLEGRGKGALTADEMAVDLVSDNNTMARTQLRPDGTIYFAYNPVWFRDHSPEAAVGLLIHEVGHIDHGHHGPAFWGRVVGNYHIILDDPSAVESAVGRSLDWRAVARWLVDDPRNITVDNSVETPYERRVAVAERLGLNPEALIQPFTNMRSRFSNEATRTVGLYQVVFDPVSIEDVLTTIHSDADPRLRFDEASDKWVVKAPEVAPLPDERRPPDAPATAYEVCGDGVVMTYISQKIIDPSAEIPVKVHASCPRQPASVMFDPDNRPSESNA